MCVQLGRIGNGHHALAFLLAHLPSPLRPLVYPTFTCSDFAGNVRLISELYKQDMVKDW